MHPVKGRVQRREAVPDIPSRAAEGGEEGAETRNAALGEGADRGGADDVAIGMGGDGLRGGMVGDAEAGRKGQVGHLAEGLQAFGEFGRERLAFAGDAAHGDDVDEAVASRDKALGTLRRGGGGDEGNPRESGGLGDGTQLGLFLVRHVDDQEAIDARRDGVCAEALGAVGEDGIIVGEEDEAGLGMFGAEARGEVENLGQIDASRKGLLTRGLDGASIADSVSAIEGNPQGM